MQVSQQPVFIKPKEIAASTAENWSSHKVTRPSGPKLWPVSGLGFLFYLFIYWWNPETLFSWFEFFVRKMHENKDPDSMKLFHSTFTTMCPTLHQLKKTFSLKQEWCTCVTQVLAAYASAAANWHAECLFVSPTGASLFLPSSLAKQQKAILSLSAHPLTIWQLSSEWEAACTLTPGNYCARLMNSIIRLGVSVSLAVFVCWVRERREGEATETGKRARVGRKGAKKDKEIATISIQVSLFHWDKKQWPGFILRLKKEKKVQCNSKWPAPSVCH